jgi:hypothetical protein
MKQDHREDNPVASKPGIPGIITGVILPLCLAGCMGDGSIEVTGSVNDHSAEPIAGAWVYLDMSPRTGAREMRTAADGDFHLFDLVAPGDYTIPLVVEAKGFKPARLDIRTSRENLVLVKLAPETSGMESSIVHARHPGR